MLRDPTLVASCIPGATLTAAAAGDTYQGTMRVKFGPTTAIFRGEARLTYDDAAQRCSIEGRGIDGRGASRALASGVVSVSGTASTILQVEGSFTVTGPLETFANAGGVHVARAILAEFAENMARTIAHQRVAAPEQVTSAELAANAFSGDPSTPPTSGSSEAAGAGPGQPAAQSEPRAGSTLASGPALSGARLLWRVFRGWLRQLFFAKGKAG